MKQHRSLIFLLILTAAFLTGCSSAPGPESLDTTKFTIESTDIFERLDPSLQGSIKCTGLQERILPDGRLEVVANVKNQEDRRIDLQINCVFKDEQGVSTGDETPFRHLSLNEHATQTVQFTSVNNQARKYTIRVREAR
jgi:uncharacterized protein YcfL